MIAVRVTDEVRPIIVASRTYLERRGRPKTPDDLASQNCIRLHLSGDVLLPWRLVQNGKSFEVAVEGTLIVNDLPLALRGARDGLGLLYLHPDYAQSFIAQGELETLLDDWAPRMDGFFLYYSSRRHM